jgi:hypothetical protein
LPSLYHVDFSLSLPLLPSPLPPRSFHIQGHYDYQSQLTMPSCSGYHQITFHFRYYRQAVNTKVLNELCGRSNVARVATGRLNWGDLFCDIVMDSTVIGLPITM